MNRRGLVPRFRRAATWSAALLAPFLVAVVVALLVLGRLPHPYERTVVLALLLGLVVALATSDWLGRRVARLVRPDVRSPEETLRILGERASRGVPMEELLLQVAESLRAVHEASSVEVWTGDGTHLDLLLRIPRVRAGNAVTPRTSLDAEALRLLARTSIAGDGWLRLWLPHLLDGREGETVRAVPALHAGSVLGLVVVNRTAGGGFDARAFTESEERTLVEVGRRLGLLLHNRELDSALQSTLDDLRRTNEELRASRARLVAASDDVRRRIERDLHDGAQQHLVAMAVNLSLAAGLIEDDPAAARELVEETRLDAHRTVGELRDLAHGIYPSLLIESGLGQALRSLSLRTSTPRSGFVIATDEVGRCLPSVEAAVYFCCLEALQNAAKHAPGARVEVALRRHGRTLQVEVVDDGPGLPPTARRNGGQGLQNMTDRLGAVGGRVTWSAPPGGGTRVLLEVPDAVDESGRP